jgi:acyl-coenzyme A synthetase/AMP-(fatty) acid ligase
LLGHPDVDDVAVLGIADDYAGQRPKAYVVLKHAAANNREKIAKDLLKYVQEKKVRDKWVYEIELIDEIPKSASGKILRRVLRDLSKSGRKGLVVRVDRTRAKL